VVVLRNRRQIAALQPPEGLHQQRAGEGGEAVVEGGGGLARSEGDAALQKDVAGVDPLAHKHGGDAAVAFAVDDHPVDR